VDCMLKALNVSTMGVRGSTCHRHREREMEETRHADVLRDVFPEHIVHKLLKGEKVDPEHREQVTIFCSDVYESAASKACQKRVKRVSS